MKLLRHSSAPWSMTELCPGCGSLYEIDESDLRLDIVIEDYPDSDRFTLYVGCACGKAIALDDEVPRPVHSRVMKEICCDNTSEIYRDPRNFTPKNPARCGYRHVPLER